MSLDDLLIEVFGVERILEAIALQAHYQIEFAGLANLLEAIAFEAGVQQKRIDVARDMEAVRLEMEAEKASRPRQRYEGMCPSCWKTRLLSPMHGMCNACCEGMYRSERSNPTLGKVLP